MKGDGKVRFPYCFPAVPRCHDGEQKASAIFNTPLSGLAPCQPVPGTSCRALWGHSAGVKRQKETTNKERATRTGDKQGNRNSIETDIQGNGLGAKWAKEVRSGRSTLHFVFSHCRLPCPSMHLPMIYLAFHISNSCSYSSLLPFPLKVAFPWQNSLKFCFLQILICFPVSTLEQHHEGEHFLLIPVFSVNENTVHGAMKGEENKSPTEHQLC